MSDRNTLILEDDSMKITRLETEPFGTNAYLITCQKSNSFLLIDTPGSAAELIDHMGGEKPCLVIITHAHMDHLTALEEIKEELQVPIAAHEGDAAGLPLKPDRLLKDGDNIECGDLKLKVLHTPGHTKGSICLHISGYLFSGDTLFPGGPGKTGSSRDFKEVISSLETKIFTLPGDTIILPGHGEKGILKKEKAAFDSFKTSGMEEGICGDVTWS